MFIQLPSPPVANQRPSRTRPASRRTLGRLGGRRLCAGERAEAGRRGVQRPHLVLHQPP